MIGRWTTPKVTEEAKPKSFDDFDLRLGDIMRGERATLGKSLLDVQRELKIKAAYIAAIENADPTAFETQGFVAGYVRSYARYLGLDPEWAYGKFCQEGKFVVAHGMSAAASSPRAIKVERQSSEPRDPFSNPNTPFAPRGQALLSRIEPGALGSLAVLVALIGGLGYGGWSVLQDIQKVQFAPIDLAPSAVAEVDALPAADEQVIAAATEATGIEAPSTDALDRLYRPQALDVPVLVARDGPIAAINPRQPGATLRSGDALGGIATASVAGADGIRIAAGSDGGDNTSILPSPVQVVEPDAPELVMFAVRPSWVRVRSADGTVIFEKILDAGESYTLPKTEDAPTLRAGNAGSVYFAVNGTNYGPVGKSGAVVSNVAVTVEALKTNYAVADLSADRDLADYVAVAQARQLPVPTE